MALTARGGYFGGGRPSPWGKGDVKTKTIRVPVEHADEIYRLAVRRYGHESKQTFDETRTLDLKVYKLEGQDVVLLKDLEALGFEVVQRSHSNLASDR